MGPPRSPTDAPPATPAIAAADAVRPLLLVEALGKAFETAEGVVRAVDGVSFAVAKGEIVALIGPSGCGKSTVFNIIGGLTPASEGRVVIDGEAVSGPHAAIGMVFQEESTLPWRTVVENVAFPLEIAGMRRGERLETAMEFVRLVGLAGFERRYPAELSGGMRQRVSIARALAFRPKILLMDEPFASLDEQTRLLLGDKVLEIQQDLAQTILLITHNITEAVQLSDRILVMSYRPRPHQARGGDRPAAPAHLRDRLQRSLRPLRRRDLGRPARGGEPRHAPGRAPRARRGAAMMRALAKTIRAAPALVGLASLAALFLAVEALIRIGAINRYVVPLPSEVGAALPRLVAEEDVAGRFLTTAGEAAGAGLLLAAVGIPLGVLALPLACRLRGGGELGRGDGRRAASPRLPAVPGDLRSQRAHHRRHRLCRGAGPGDPQHAGGPACDAEGAHRHGARFQAVARSAVLEDRAALGPAQHVHGAAARPDLCPPQRRRAWSSSSTSAVSASSSTTWRSATTSPPCMPPSGASFWSAWCFSWAWSGSSDGCDR